MKRRFSIVLVSALALTACGGGVESDAIPTVPAPGATLEISAVAGPVCPVETDPPTPGCAPRPVADAVMVVTDSTGAEMARAATSADGTVVIEVPAGELTITPQPVEGLLGTASPITVSLAADQTLSVGVDYDTGIR
jgi:hypothetical protein